MFCSVIISTYNSPEWLEKSLWGYAAQSFADFEIVVADDGSSSRTAALVSRLCRQTGLDIQHVWQEHAGFRKCRILNQAIAATRGKYLVFSDGDCIPRRDFLAQHLEFAEAGRFLSGGMLRLPRDTSERITANDIVDGSAFQIRWLRARGMPYTHKLRYLLASRRLAWWLDRFSTTHATFNGHNSSAWKADVLRVNGFDERMEYGGLDRELGERLVNAGVHPKRIRHAAVCLHLDHDRCYVRAESLAFNRELRRRTRGNRITWTDYGVFQVSRSVPEIAPLPSAQRPSNKVPLEIAANT